jgi:protein-L-isoaspartate(D-aspartate) O-methyltransferase
MNSNDGLIDYLKDEGSLESEALERAFKQVDRANFTPNVDDSHREGEVFVDRERNPYTNEVYPVSDNSTISQPSVVAQMLEFLEPESGDDVLEVGSGSGYQAAVISGVASSVIGVEIEPEVADYSRRKLEKYQDVEIRQGNGLEQVDSQFDKIIFSCAVDEETFRDAKLYLKPEGRLVAPVGTGAVQEITVYDGNEEEEFREGRVRFIRYKDE